MKGFSLFVKYVLVPCSTLVGMVYGFDMYIINRAKTEVQKVKSEFISVRNADMEHLNHRFDNLDKKLDRVEYLINRK